MHVHGDDVRPVALITGGAGGIGAAVARRLAAGGHDICIGFRASPEPAHAVRDECEARGAGAIALGCDVAEDADCRRIVADTLARFGRLDVLVNAAGTTRFVAADDLDGLQPADWQRVFAVNVTGAFQMTRAAAIALADSGRGSVVNVSSFAASLGFGSSLAYACSKGALNTLTLGLARTLAPKVRVNAVCPSFVETPWVTRGLEEAAWNALKQRIEQASPMRRVATPGEIAETIAWLASSAPAVTGELVASDSGMRLAHPLAPSRN